MVSAPPKTPPADPVGENAALSAPADPPGGTPAPAVPANHLPAPDGNALHFTEVDDQATLDNDSAFGVDTGTDNDRTSLASGITKYREENGRRYHAFKDGVYLLPNDNQEQDRLDMHHHIFTLIRRGKLYRAPIEKPARVLDVGCGTGIWAIDFADAHPESHVVGMDLSPIQPGWIPPNLEFVVDDCEDPWTDTTYDYIHIRMLAGAILSWRRLLTQAFDHLNPGGWLELTEFELKMRSDDDTMEHATAIRQWSAGFDQAAEIIGRTTEIAPFLKEWLEDIGFDEVTEETEKIPSAPWARDKRLKEIGLYQQQNMLDSSTSYGQAHFTRVLGWKPEEYAVLSAKVRNEFRNPNFRIYSVL